MCTLLNLFWYIEGRIIYSLLQGELELLMMEEEADNRKHFNLKAIMKESTKKKKPSQDSKDSDDFQVAHLFLVVCSYRLNCEWIVEVFLLYQVTYHGEYIYMFRWSLF